MKKNLLTIIVSLLSVYCFAQQDTIANAGFEQWNFNPQYDDPVNWTTLNPLASALGAQLAYKADASGEYHSGTAAIKLVTTSVTGIGITPAILTNGMINVQTQSIEGGSAMNSRPMSFGGWFRFDPISTDTAFFNVRLTKWNTVMNSRDNIATIDTVITGTSGAFVNFELPFEYYSTETPDTVLLLFGSGTNTAPQEGSALFVDDLYYTYPQGIEDATEFGVSVFPNPALNTIRIGNENGLRFSQAHIFSIDGKMVMNESLANRAATIDVSGLTTGTYLLRLETMDGQQMIQKFVKE